MIGEGDDGRDVPMSVSVSVCVCVSSADDAHNKCKRGNPSGQSPMDLGGEA